MPMAACGGHAPLALRALWGLSARAARDQNGWRIVLPITPDRVVTHHAACTLASGDKVSTRAPPAGRRRLSFPAEHRAAAERRGLLPLAGDESRKRRPLRSPLQ